MPDYIEVIYIDEKTGKKKKKKKKKVKKPPTLTPE